MIRGWSLPHRSALLSALRGLATSAAGSKEVSFYELLEVKKNAEPWEVKAAFRKKAKLLHPDAQSQSGRADREAFVRLLHAYQVLHNPRSRALYDLSINSKEHSVLRRAAASGVHGGSVDEDLEIDLSWGLGSLFKRAPEGPQSNMLDKLRGELQSDLHAALRYAYLGPKLELEEEHELPEAFEGDERSTPECPDLLELVSGRQLLGAVRERRAAQLGGRGRPGPTLTGGPEQEGAGGLIGAAGGWGAGGAQQQQHGGQQGLGGEGAAGSPTPGANEINSGSCGGPAVNWEGAAEAPTGSSTSSTDAAGSTGAASSTDGASSTNSGSARSSEGTLRWGRLEGVSQEEEEPEVLELIMGEQVVARAVRQSQRAEREGASSEGPSGRQGSGNGSGSLGPEAGSVSSSNSSCATANSTSSGGGSSSGMERGLVREGDGTGGRLTPRAASAAAAGAAAAAAGAAAAVAGAAAATAAAAVPFEQHQPRQSLHGESSSDSAQAQQELLSHKNSRPHEECRFSSGGVQQPREQKQKQEQVVVVSFYRGDQLLGTLQAEHKAATSNSPSAARFLNPEGIHTHTVLRSSSPLVRHLSIVAEPSTGVATIRRSKAVVFRARRAWLPPSALWLFRPRNYEHDIGGWYFEWAGHSSCSHPAWIDPAVAVLTAGYDSLDHERAKQQPQGLFSRLRVGDETASGVGGWLRAMLRFHGVRK